MEKGYTAYVRMKDYLLRRATVLSDTQSTIHIPFLDFQGILSLTSELYRLNVLIEIAFDHKLGIIDGIFVFKDID